MTKRIEGFMKAFSLKIGFFVGVLAALTAINGFSDSSSLYSLRTEWKDDQGKALKFDTFQKNWTVISMMYTRCPGSCPMIVQKMRKVETLLKNHQIDAQFVLVTFDPKRDTPAQLKLHRGKIAVSETNWHFLNGGEGDTRKLSMLLGIKFTQDAETGDFMHDNKLILVSPSGKIAARLNTLNDPEDEFLKAIQKGE